MEKKTLSIVQRGIFVLSIFLGTFTFSGLANATGSDSQTFILNPSHVGTTSPFVWPTTLDLNGVYARNAYWNFNVNPFTTGALPSGNPDATYYGFLDPSLKSGDSFQSTGSVAWNGATKEQIGYTATGNNQGGTAVYSFNTLGLKNSADYLYVWAEINVTTTGKATDNFVSFSGLTGSGSTLEASEIFASTGGSPLASSSTGLFSFDMTGTAKTYDAYFSVLDPNKTENLTLSFTTGNGSNEGSVFVNSLHVAVSPEPISMVLFATGVAVLFFFKRRRFALA